MEEILNNITSNTDGSYHITSCSLSDASVVSFAKYYPDWFALRSCTNDGRQPQYMRDQPNGFLFAKIEDCCKAHFSWDETCGLAKDPSALLFYPNYDKSTCNQKSMAEFDMYDTEKYMTKDACCKDKFSIDVGTCCESGQGECSSSNHLVYIPNWVKQECTKRDKNWLMEYEAEWISSTVEECCEKYFRYSKNCGASENKHKYHPNYDLMECEKTTIQELDAYENESFDSLHDCCRKAFPNSITSCCHANDAGGCEESGILKWLPDWSNSYCYAKDSTLIEDWEDVWTQDNVKQCCSRYFQLDSKYCNERNLETLKFFAASGHCSKKPLSEFSIWEERFDSLNDCCRTKFPETLSDCCDAKDLGSCVLSGNLRYIPNWGSQLCYSKDAYLLATWEQDFSKDTLRECCEHNMFYDVTSCCSNSKGGC